MNNAYKKTQEQEQDIIQILKNAGVKHPGSHPFTTHHLPKILLPNEHVIAAVYGRRRGAEGFFGFVEGLLVATDKRVLYVDHRPGYTTTDEIAYDVVTGINVSSTIFFASITLFTKIANYKLSYVNQSTAQQFVDHIEARIIEHNENNSPYSPQLKEQVAPLDDETLDFLRDHQAAVLSSIDRTGNVDGATIYYTIIRDDIHFITRPGTKKAANILGNQHIALTIFDEYEAKTLQLQGIVEIVSDTQLRDHIISNVTKPRHYEDGSSVAPVMRMSGDGFAVYKIIPIHYNLTDFLHTK